MHLPSHIVSNTSPLITLVEKLPPGVGRKIFSVYQEVLIPEAVIDELIEDLSKSRSDYLKHYNLDGLFSIHPVTIDHSIIDLHKLDPGESEAITLAKQTNLNLIIDEKAGRKIAQNSGLTILKAPEQIVIAYQHGIITQQEAENYLDILLKIPRIHLKLYNDAIAAIRDIG